MTKIVFNHGKESGPWGHKIEALAKVAKSRNFAVDSIDYQDQMDPDDRADRLTQYLNEDEGDHVILVGSSMGGYVALANSQHSKVRGCFVMAPALYMGGKVDFDRLHPNGPVSVVHGWQDDIVNWQNSVKFCQRIAAELHLIDDDHRLINRLDVVVRDFILFLESMA